MYAFNTVMSLLGGLIVNHFSHDVIMSLSLVSFLTLKSTYLMISVSTHTFFVVAVEVCMAYLFHPFNSASIYHYI